MKQKLYANFAHPRGLYGRAAGRIMAAKADNLARSAWAIEQLAPAPDLRVLELGFGPGVSLSDLCRRVTDGTVVGVDISKVMYAQAAKRNAAAIRAGVLTLHVGDAQHLDADLRDFDLILGINVWQFWADQGTVIAELAERLSPGGRLALVYMQPPASTLTGADASARLRRQFQGAGLESIEHIEMNRAPTAVMVLAERL